MRWVGGASGEWVKEAESRASGWSGRRMQRLIQGQTKRMRMAMTLLRMASRSILYQPCGAGSPPQSDASLPESGTPIGPRPLPGTAAIARSSLILHLARHGRAAETSRSKPRDMNRLAPNSRPVLQQLAEGCASLAYPLGHPWCSAVGADQCACFVRTPCGPSDPGRTACPCLVAASSRWRCGRICAVRGRHWWPWWRAKIDGKTPL